jgi:hypothetical protein
MRDALRKSRESQGDSGLTRGLLDSSVDPTRMKVSNEDDERLNVIL